MLRILLVSLLIVSVAGYGTKFIQTIDDLSTTLKDEIEAASAADATNTSVQKQYLSIRPRILQEIGELGLLGYAAWAERNGFESTKFKIHLLKLNKTKEQYMLALKQEQITKENGLAGFKALLEKTENLRKTIKI